MSIRKPREAPSELAIASELERFLHATYKAGGCPGCSNPVQRLMPKVMEIVDRISAPQNKSKTKGKVMKLVAVVLAVGIWATGTVVQAQMQMSPAPLIDGSKNPELIPDIVAYRLWYVQVSHVDAETRSTFLNATLLSASDQAQMVKELAGFAIQYDAIALTRHNAVVAAKGKHVDPASYLQSLTDLVNQTNKEVQSLLSPAGWKQFQAFIQWSKAGDKINQGVTI